ncbi:MAG: extracellular solute-binding protein [Lachnospirales bacterium]
MRYNNLRRFLAGGLIATLSMSLVACGSTGASENDDNGGSETSDTNSQDIEITFWNGFTGADGDMLVEMVEQYNSENTDGITVSMDISADLDSQLATAFAGDVGPTLLLTSSAARFTYGDYLQDLSDVFDNTSLEKSDFIQSYLDYCSDNDKLYFVPFQIVGFYMYWNKDLFEAAGLDPEAPPTTWDEWEEYAEVLTDSSKNVYGSGLSYDYTYQISHIIQRFGGLAVTDDNGSWVANFSGNEGYKEFLDMYKDMIENGYNPLEADTDSMATAGQVGMTINGPWLTYGLDTAELNYGIGLIPEGLAGDMNSVEVLGFSVTTSASDEEKQAAYKFIEWWNTPDEEGKSPALEWSVANGFPAYTYSVQEHEDYQASEKLSAMSAANPDAPTDFIVDSNFPGINAVISEVISQAINEAAFGNMSSDEILENAQSLTEEIISDYE